jgi:hypothetical protein
MTFNAQAARKLAQEAQSLNGQYARPQTDKLLKELAEAATRGASSFQADIEYVYRDIIVKRLEELGFTVERCSGDQRDPYDYYNISW